MGWWIPLAMAATSMLQESEKSKGIERQNLSAAETNRYSPWTGMQGQIQSNQPNYLGAGIKGGLQGYMLGQGIGGSGSAAVADQAAASTPYSWSRMASMNQPQQMLHPSQML